MAKVVLSPVVSGYNLQKINDNFQTVAEVINEDVLSRRNPPGEPNEMHNNLDMNSNRIYNLPAPGADHEPVRLKDINDLIADHDGQGEAKFINFDPYGFVESTNVQGAMYEIIDKVQEGALYTVTAYGAVGDGVTDSTAGIQAAINLARDNGGVVYFPAGTYLVSSTLVLYHKTALRGSSRHNTIIQLANGSNQNVIAGLDAETLLSAPTFDSTVGANMVEITDLTIDGNRLNQTSGRGVVIYGYGTKIRNVTIQNCKWDGLYTGFTDASVPMEGTFENVVIDKSGFHGWRNHGPHDSHSMNVIVIDASQEQNEGYNGIFTHEVYSNGRYYNCHVWNRSSTTNRPAYAFNSGGGNEVIGSHLEGCIQQVIHRGSGDRFIGCLFYAPFGDDLGSLVIFNNNSNMHVGCRYSASGAPPINNNTYGIQFGADVLVSNNMVVGGSFDGFGNLGAFRYENSGGNYVLNCRGYANAGGVTTFSGAIHVNDEIDYTQTGTVITRRKMMQLPAYADNAAALSAGLVWGDQYRNSTTNAIATVV